MTSEADAQRIEDRFDDLPKCTNCKGQGRLDYGRNDWVICPICQGTKANLNLLTAKKVWIVYRTWSDGLLRDGNKKVEYIVSTEDAAMAYVERMKRSIDTKFGVATQAWFLDD